MANYKCPALGECDHANAGEVFERAPGEEVKCPGCSQALVLQAGDERTASPRKGLAVTVAAAALVVLAGGGYLFAKRGTPAADAAPPVAAAPAPAEAAPPAAPGMHAMAAAGGIAPSESETAALKRESETELRNGKPERAEAASTRAATNEMLKIAISKMAQGKLDDAEKELEAARAHDDKEPLVYYNLAVLRLKQSRTDDALNQFEAAFMGGFSHYQAMDADPDLETMRKNPRFVDLVKKYRPAGA